MSEKWVEQIASQWIRIALDVRCLLCCWVLQLLGVGLVEEVGRVREGHGTLRGIPYWMEMERESWCERMILRRGGDEVV